MNYRTIKSRGFWCDPWLLQQPKLVRYFYNYLFTGPLTNNAGLLEESPMEMALHTGLTAKEIDGCIEALISADKLIRYEGWLWIINFIKHQSSTSPLLIKSIGKTLEECPHEQLVAAVLNKYSHLEIPYRYPIDTLSIPPPELEVELKKKSELKKEIYTRQPARKKPPFDPSVVVDLFREIMPQLPQPRKIDGPRRVALLARMKEHPDPKWWRDYFTLAAKNPWYFGGSDGTWFADFDFFLRPKKITKITEAGERNYDIPGKPRPGETDLQYIQRITGVD